MTLHSFWLSEYFKLVMVNVKDPTHACRMGDADLKNHQNIMTQVSTMG